MQKKDPCFMQHSRTWVLAIYMSRYYEEIAQDHEPHIITNIQLLVIEKRYNRKV